MFILYFLTQNIFIVINYDIIDLEFKGFLLKLNLCLISYFIIPNSLILLFLSVSNNIFFVCSLSLYIVCSIALPIPCSQLSSYSFNIYRHRKPLLHEDSKASKPFYIFYFQLWTLNKRYYISLIFDRVNIY